MAIRKGTSVRQIVTPIEGVVESFSVDQETGDVQYLVAYTGEDGQPRARYFKLDELEENVPA